MELLTFESPSLTKMSAHTAQLRCPRRPPLSHPTSSTSLLLIHTSRSRLPWRNPAELQGQRRRKRDAARVPLSLAIERKRLCLWNRLATAVSGREEADGRPGPSGLAWAMGRAVADHLRGVLASMLAYINPGQLPLQSPNHIHLYH